MVTSPGVPSPGPSPVRSPGRMAAGERWASFICVRSRSPAPASPPPLHLGSSGTKSRVGALALVPQGLGTAAPGDPASRVLPSSEFDSCPAWRPTQVPCSELPARHLLPLSGRWGCRSGVGCEWAPCHALCCSCGSLVCGRGQCRSGAVTSGCREWGWGWALSVGGGGWGGVRVGTEALAAPCPDGDAEPCRALAVPPRYVDGPCCVHRGPAGRATGGRSGF